MKKIFTFFYFCLFSICSFSQSVLVKDINPGDGNSFNLFSETIAFGDKLIFVVDDGTTGSELWISDGTEAGTVLLKDIYSGTNTNFAPRFMTEYNGAIYFQANDDTLGTELWKTDGTVDGTVMVKDIRSGSAGSVPRYFSVFNNKLIFAATDSDNNREIWETDGTEAGTKLFLDILGDASSDPVWITPTDDGRIFFGAQKEEFLANKVLYVSDGTQAGTTQLTTDTYLNPNDRTRFDMDFTNGNLYFTGQNQMSGTYYPWVSDGTVAGTKLIKEIGDGFSNTAKHYTEINGKVVFGADEQLWVTDGTESGTTKLRDLVSGGFFPFNGKLLFNGDDNFFNGGTSAELYETDGTSSGTRLVKNIDSGSFASDPSNMVLYEGEVYFSADTYDDGREIWKTDGTNAGTKRMSDVNPMDANIGGALYLTVVGDKLFFANNDGVHGYELWLYNSPPVLSVEIEVTQPVLCWGDANGILTMNVFGGFPPYSYKWEPDVSTENIAENLPAGTYNVTATDNVGSEITISYRLLEPEELSAGGEIINETNMQQNGSANIFGVGGTPPYSYLWSTGDTTGLIENLSAGTYNLTLTDANGCLLLGPAIIDNTSSINNPILNQIQINPTLVTEGIINIENVLVSTPYDLNLITMSGQTAFNQKNNIGNSKIQINQPPGVYLMKIQFEKETLVRKILIQ